MAEDKKTDARLVISDETANYFGRDTIGFVNRQNMLRGPVLVASGADCDYRDMNPITRIFRKAQLEEDFSKAGLAHLVDEICANQLNVQNEGIVAGYSESTDHASWQRDETGNHRIQENGKPGFLIVTSDAGGLSQFYALATGIPSDRLAQNLPGNGKDIQTLKLFHELSHHSEDHMKGGPAPAGWHEYEADMNARKLYKKAYAEGLVSDLGLLDLHNSARAMRTGRKLYLRGDFDEKPMQKQFIETFLHGAENFAPDYFKTDGRQTEPALQSGPDQKQLSNPGLRINTAAI